MKTFLTFILLLTTLPAWANDFRYELEVDGLACPFCAYGIEKKIKSLDGVQADSLDIRLNEGLVSFESTTRYEQSFLKTLIRDAGFTLRQFNIIDVPTVEEQSE